jgi:hypothetical protein
MSDLWRTRARLTKAQVISIYQSKGKSYPANALAMCYGVSEKAVRDIWKGRTWFRETSHLPDTSGLLQVKKRTRPMKVKEHRIVSAINLESPVNIDDGSAKQHSELSMESKAWLQCTNTLAQFAHHQVSVDEQLHEWNQSMWLDAASQEADPFLHDWRPTSCDSF